MNIRKITALTALASFIVLVINSIVLYVVPQGRVAYWADWRIWGLSNTKRGDQHIIIGILFLVAISLHIFYNWKPIISYLKNRSGQLKVFTSEFNIALVITIVCILGSYFMLPPFNWVFNLSAPIKEKEGAAVQYGEPLYGHAERSSIKTLTRRMGLDLTLGMELLKKAGIKFENEKQTLVAIAKLNNMSPQQIFFAMQPGEKTAISTDIKKLPSRPIPGTGNQSVSAICRTYNLDIQTVMLGFVIYNIKATAEMNVKTIAEHNNVSPVDLYDIIKKITEFKPETPQNSVQTALSDATVSPKGTPTGLGRMTLAQVCKKYNIDLSVAVEQLFEKGLAAKPEEKLKMLAERYDKNPIDFYEIIK